MAHEPQVPVIQIDPSATLPNLAFIDGQNLYLGTREHGWAVDYRKFRVYLTEKYNISEAYYFLGFIIPDQQEMYDSLQKAGFIVSFREQSGSIKGKKKGNVDTDIVFAIMRKLIEQEPFGKAFIVSNDGDYKRMVSFLVKKEKFGKMLFPNEEFSSSLYNMLGGEYFDYLDAADVKKKIEYARTPKMKKAP